MNRRLLAGLLVAVLVGTPAALIATSVGGTGTATAGDASPDPEEDVLGWENGYWYNESIDVDQSDGLSRSELDAFVARSMARVEYLRQLEFTQNVTVQPIARNGLRAVAANTTFYNDTTFGTPTNEQLWEATFLIDEPTSATETIQQYQTAVVLGYAAEEGSDRIVIVTENPENPVIGSTTLIHELAHMLQDQQFNLSRQKYRPGTLDGEFSKNGLVEGGATYVHQLYTRKCGDEWECVDAPGGWSDTGSSNHAGLSRLSYQPYSDGPVYIDELIQRGGWDAVNAAYESPPNSTEQIIHPGEPVESPAPISFEDTSRDGWTAIDRQGAPFQRIGEAGIYTMFWYQANRHEISALEEQISTATDLPFDTYNYTSAPSAGWGNDRLVAYAKGDEHGYVWKTVWDTARDAKEFYRAYRQVLDAHNAVERGERTWIVRNGSYADAFRVVRDGKSVVIVNGPTIDDLEDIRPRNETAGRAAMPTLTRAAGESGAPSSQRHRTPGHHDARTELPSQYSAKSKETARAISYA